MAGRAPDVRRFRPNIVVRLPRPHPFEEDNWVGGVLLFGDPGEGPRVSVTMRDVRCSMVNFDPDSGRADPEVLKSIVRTHQNTAGVYGTVIRIGRVTVGQTVRLQELVEEVDPNCMEGNHHGSSNRPARRNRSAEYGLDKLTTADLDAPLACPFPLPISDPTFLSLLTFFYSTTATTSGSWRSSGSTQVYPQRSMCEAICCA